MPEQDPIEQRWRTGSKVTLNVYCGDTPMFQCHTPEQAIDIVGLLNAGAALLHPDPDIRCDSEVGLLHAELAEQSEENKRLKQERDEARRDSARLDWLEGKGIYLDRDERGKRLVVICHGGNAADLGTGGTLRVAIDAAMAVSKAGPDVLK